MRQDKKTLVVFLDHRGAFNKAWRAGALHKLLEKGVPTALVRWYEAFLEGRQAQVRWGSALSSWRPMRQGTAQGTNSAPTIFDVLVDDMPEVSLQYADDACIVAQGATVAECVAEANRKLEAVSRWVTEWRLPLNLGKAREIAFWLPKGATQVRRRGRTVVEVAEGCAAWRAGLRPGWRIDGVEKAAGAKLSATTKEGSEALEEAWAAAAATGRRVAVTATEFPAVRVHGEPIAYEETPVYLGVKYDEKLSFGPHVAMLREKMEWKHRTLAALCGTSWGCSARTTRMTYSATTLAAVEHAVAAWRPYATAKLTQQLETEHNKAAKLITGCMPKTRTEVLLSEALLQPLWVRAERRVAQARERFRRLATDCPAHEAEGKMPATRLELREGLRGLRREPHADPGALPAWEGGAAVQFYPELLRSLRGLRREPHADPGALPAWEGGAAVQFYPELLRTVPRTEAALIRRLAVLETLHERGEKEWEAWTDGSVSDGGVGRGGAGGVILRRGKEGLREADTLTEAAGRLASSYTTEVRAIRKALEKLEELMPVGPTEVLIATDSQSAVRALAAGPDRQRGRQEQEIWRLMRRNFSEASGRKLTVQWVASHCGLEHNEKADQLAKRASELPQEEVPVAMRTAAAAVGRAAEKEWARMRLEVLEAARTAGQQRHPYLTLPGPPRARGGGDAAEGEREGEWLSAAALMRQRPPRAVERVIHQMRAGKTRYCADWTGGINWTATGCPRCPSASDGVQHLLEECTHAEVVELRRRHLGNRTAKQSLTSEYHRLAAFVGAYLELHHDKQWLKRSGAAAAAGAAPAAEAGAQEPQQQHEAGGGGDEGKAGEAGAARGARAVGRAAEGEHGPGRHPGRQPSGAAAMAEKGRAERERGGGGRAGAGPGRHPGRHQRGAAAAAADTGEGRRRGAKAARTGARGAEAATGEAGERQKATEEAEKADEGEAGGAPLPPPKRRRRAGAKQEAEAAERGKEGQRQAGERRAGKEQEPERAKEQEQHVETASAEGTGETEHRAARPRASDR
eukprot:gene4310-6455_t